MPCPKIQKTPIKICFSPPLCRNLKKSTDQSVSSTRFRNPRQPNTKIHRIPPSICLLTDEGGDAQGFLFGEKGNRKRQLAACVSCSFSAATTEARGKEHPPTASLGRGEGSRPNTNRGSLDRAHEGWKGGKPREFL